MQLALAFAPVLILAVVLCFLVPVLTRLLSPSRTAELTTEWFEGFQLSNYAPMQGLLSRDDFQFLSGQPGYDAALCRKLRRERLRIFRQYLNRLIVDFNRLHTLASFVMSQDAHDHSALFAKLISLRFHFWLAILQVEFRYMLCRLGASQLVLGELLQHLDEISSLAVPSDVQSLLAS